MYKGLRLCHHPNRHKNVKVGAFGVTARPFEDRLKVGCFFYLFRSCIVERCVVDGAQHLPCGLVAQGQKVRKVVLAKGCIVLLQSRDTLVFFNCCFQRTGYCCLGLYALTMLLPFFKGFLTFGLCHKGIIIGFECAYNVGLLRHHLHDILVLVGIEEFEQLRCKVFVCL